MATKTERAALVNQEARCECGQLIAKLQRTGIELKCKRCKRIVAIPFSSMEGHPAPYVRSGKKASAPLS